MSYPAPPPYGGPPQQGPPAAVPPSPGQYPTAYASGAYPGAPRAPYAYPVRPASAPVPRPVRAVAARVLLVVDLLLLVGAILLPLVQSTGGLVDITIAESGRPSLAPVGISGAEATVTWWLVVTYVALVVQAVAVCLALARVLPTWVAGLLGVLGTLALAASLVTVAMVAFLVRIEPEIEVGWGTPCLAIGQFLFLVVMLAPSLVRGWKS